MIEQALLHSLVLSRSLTEEKLDSYRHEAEVYRMLPRTHLRTRIAAFLRAAANRLEPLPQEQDMITLKLRWRMADE